MVSGCHYAPSFSNIDNLSSPTTQRCPTDDYGLFAEEFSDNTKALGEMQLRNYDGDLEQKYISLNLRIVHDLVLFPLFLTLSGSRTLEGPKT